MKTDKIWIFFFVFIIAASITYSFQANSSNYKQNLIVSSGGEIVNSNTYKSYAAIGIIAGITNSSTYKNWLGFFYTWLLADNQPCASASQCEGGYCCSNLCKSSACPTEEAPAAGGGGAAAGGGGGMAPNITGVGLLKIKDYSVNPSSIKAKLALGESSEKKLKIKNEGSTDLIISLRAEGVKDYLSLSKEFIDLKVGEQEEVKLEFIGKRVGSFVGKVTASAGEIEKIVPIIIEVISKLVLFDAKLDIPVAYAEVEPGEDLKAQITLLNVGAPEKVDVLITYFIKDLSGNIIYEETETFAVEKQISYQKVFRIHKSTVPGSYVAIIELRYADSFAVSSQLFMVVEKKAFAEMEKITKNTTLMIFLTFILIGIISMLAYKLASISKSGSKKKKVKKQK